jgi:hypothetical protein
MPWVFGDVVFSDPSFEFVEASLLMNAHISDVSTKDKMGIKSYPFLSTSAAAFLVVRPHI